MNATNIAPCGMNCTLCRSYQRKTRNCLGCRSGDQHKTASCIHCSMKTCEFLAQSPTSLCCDCQQYPCKKLSMHDRRLKARYQISVLDNLNAIQSQGMEHFLSEQTTAWVCPTCNQLLSMHRKVCIHCKTPVTK